MDGKGDLTNLNVTVKKYAIPGDTLTCKGTVVDKWTEDKDTVIKVDLEIVNQDDKSCVIGDALMKLSR